MSRSMSRPMAPRSFHVKINNRFNFINSIDRWFLLLNQDVEKSEIKLLIIVLNFSKKPIMKNKE